MTEQRSMMRSVLPVIFIAITLGVGAGYVLSSKIVGTSTVKTATTSTVSGDKNAALKVGDVFGNPDEKTFKDSAEGVLLVGGVNGEGSFHVVREGGESQNVYLTSSVLDLNQFVNHKVKVWGETFKAQRAGWLMDVGRVQVVELNAQLPDWAAKALQKACAQKKLLP